MSRPFIHHPVVCFGETLWDVLPSSAEPGGAPMNVAYHLHKLGWNPAVITSIGVDQEGKQLMKIFSAFGVCTDYFQVHEKYPTGKAIAKPNEQMEMVYDIVLPSAWDYIGWEQRLEELVMGADYFVFGSLAARNQVSKNTLFRLLEKAGTRVLDINLRAPHYNKEIVEELLYSTDFLKLNLAEFDLLSGWFVNATSFERKLMALSQKFQIPDIVVTMGAEGAVFFSDGRIFRHPGFVVQVADTIGSGDSFLAGLLSGLMKNESSETSLTFASGLGAFVATQKGGCPDYNMEEVNKILTSDANKRSIPSQL